MHVMQSEVHGDDAQLVLLYGGLDESAAAGLVDREELEFWLPPYVTSAGNRSATGWFSEFRGPDPTFPTDPLQLTNGALDRMAGMTGARNGIDAESDSRVVARQLLAATILSRSVPEGYAPDGSQSQHIVALLSEIVRYGNNQREDVGAAVAELHGLISAPRLRELSREAAFAEIVEQAIAAELLHESFRNHTDLPRCDDRPVEAVLSDGTSVEAVDISTSFCTSDLSADDLEHLLNPGNWDECMGSFWCGMTPVDSGDDVQRYIEEVGDCNASDGWRIRTCLMFGTRNVGDCKVLTYDLCSEADLTDVEHAEIEQFVDDLVIVDNGMITVCPAPDNGVCVTTQKRLALKGIPVEGMEVLVCATIWGQGAKDIVYACTNRAALTEITATETTDVTRAANDHTKKEATS